MYSAYSKHHLKFQNHNELLHLGTAGFYAIMVMVQQEAESLQELVKIVAAAPIGKTVCEKPHHFPLHPMDEPLQPAFPNAMHHSLYI